MKKQRILALLTAVLTLLTCTVIPINAVGSSLSLTFADDVQEGASLSLGDTVTYTVSVTANEGGFCVGTFFFLPSDNLQYESATLLGREVSAKLATDDNEGAYGITYLETEPFTASDVVFCAVTFRVVGLGDATVRFYTYQLVDSAVETVEVQIAPDTLAHPVATPDKPAVLTESLKNGVLGKLYTAVLESDFNADINEKDLSWEITDGALPAGLELLNDGTLTGTPTEFGTFTFSVTFSLFDSITSDAKELTLTVLEKPQKLELTDESTYTIGEEDGYLRNVVAETTLSALLGNFLNPESVKVFDAKGNEITDSAAFIGTGATISLMDGEEAVDSVTVVVRGDVYSDGKITVFDYANIRGYYLKTVELTGAMLEAADVNGDGKITVFDYANVRAHYLKTYNIYK